MRCNANVMGKLFLTVMLVFAVWVNSVKSAEIELSVATDQASYWPNEVITVSVTAYNPNDYEVTLDFPSSHQASYIVDDVYDWSSDKGFFDALTQVTIGPGSFHTWDFNHDWEYTYGEYTYGYDLSIGTHSVVGYLQPYGVISDYTDEMQIIFDTQSPSLEFEVIVAPPPPTDLLIDFDYYPDGDKAETTGNLLEQYAPWGVHFRTISNNNKRSPSVQSGNDNQYAKVSSTTYPPGFNIVADFDMPIYSVEVDVSSAVGRTVTMIAKDSDGAIIDSVVSASVPDVSNWFDLLQLDTTTPIASVEWWPSEQNASIWIDNLHVVSGPPPPTGDFDGDGDVDGVDFWHWQAGYPSTSGGTLDTGDADGDGDVDGVDFGIWQANYPANVGGAVMTMTPEPATLGLVLIGSLVLLRRRR